MENNIRITIPYKENQGGKSILLALGTAKDYSNMPLEVVAQLNDKFQNGDDITFEILVTAPNTLFDILNSFGFIYTVEEI